MATTSSTPPAPNQVTPMPRPRDFSALDWLIVLAGIAVGIAAVLVKRGAHDIALSLALTAVLVPVTISDLERRIIPNRITGPAAIAAIIIGLITHPAGVPAQLAGGAAGFTVLFAFAVLWKGGLGMGDVKLAGVLGVYLGASVSVAIVVAVFSSAVLGFVVIAGHGLARGRKMLFAFGPFLALGAAVGILDGPSIVHWYVHSLH
jgi:leader peptidase (prepilin peptidase) / N-methyltransferase